ncbi:MAG: hypothetical protein KatS3mg018_2008 [Fimbriimonadales bacterium]|nr:MAG: hypothetical protein KatS3mg018_2008 [Fimbriimonadales bacterium]
MKEPITTLILLAFALLLWIFCCVPLGTEAYNHSYPRVRLRYDPVYNNPPPDQARGAWR